MLYLFNFYVVLLLLQLPINILQYQISSYIIVYKDLGIVFFLSYSLIYLLHQRYIKINKFLTFYIFISLFFLIMIFNIIQFNNIFNLFWHFRNTILLPLTLLLYLSTLSLIEIETFIKFFIKFTKYYVIANLCLVFLQIYFGTEFYTIFNIPTGDEFVKNASVFGVIRPSGFFTSVDLLGFFSFFSLLLFYFINSKNIWLLMSAILVILSTSKTSILMLLALIVIIPIYKILQKHKIPLFLIFLITMFVGLVVTFLNELIMIPILFVLKTILNHEEFVFIAISLEDRVFNVWNIAYSKILELNFLELLFGNTLSSNSITNDNLYFYLINNFGIVFMLIFYIIISKLVIHNSKIILLILPILLGGITLDIVENLSFQIYFFVLTFLVFHKLFLNNYLRGHM